MHRLWLNLGDLRWSFVDGELWHGSFWLVNCRSSVEEDVLFLHRSADRGNGGTFLITVGEFSVAGGFFGMLGVGINALQSAAAHCSLGEASSPGVQGSEALVDAQVVGRHRQRTNQRSEGLGGHVVRNEKFGVGQSGADGERDLVGIMLMDRGRGRFQIVNQDDGFFRRDQLGARRAAELADHLLIILHVQSVLRLDRGKFLVEITRARELNQKLATVEPQNTLHMQNYQQVVSQLSGTTGTKLITPEEAVVLIDDLEATAPSVHQHYSDEVALAIRSALTDAELFIPYNMPAKALGPLVGALPMAPNDLRINQRLAALHTRAGRFAEAAVCCRTLQSVYSDAEHPEEATRYGELADRMRNVPPFPRSALLWKK